MEYTECSPFASDVESNSNVNTSDDPVPVDPLPNAVSSTKKTTPETPVSSDALADNDRTPENASPEAPGDIMAMDGGTVSLIVTQVPLPLPVIRTRE